MQTSPRPTTEREERAWWKPLPPADLPSIPVWRAYAEVLGVFLAFFATGIIAAALLLAGHYKDLLDGGSWAVYLLESIGVLTEIGLALTVVLLLCERRSVTPGILGLRWPRSEDGNFAASTTIRIVGWAFLAQVVGGVVNAALQTGHLPTEPSNAPELIFAVFDSVQAGVVEELVVLGFVVVTLRQAGRPLWEVCVVALVLRGSYHIYYGPGVAGILVWASMFLWIYLRTGSLFPLMLSHMIWDGVAFFSQRWSGVAVVASLGLLVLWIACVILWLVERSSRPAPASGPYSPAWYSTGSGSAQQGPGLSSEAAVQPHPAAALPGPAAPALPPPGWYPDPSGANRWRWWDGQRWTEHVSSHPRAG